MIDILKGRTLKICKLWDGFGERQVKSAVLIAGLLIIAVAGASGDAVEKGKPLPTKETQDLKSEDYVLFPYPKARAEIVADFKHAVKKNHSLGWTWLPAGALPNPSSKGHQPDYGEGLLLKVLEENSGTRVTGIEKVANRTNSVAGDFLFQIVVQDRKEHVVACWALNARGESFGGVMASKERFLSPPTSRAEALKAFARVRKPFEVKTLRRVFMANRLAPYPWSPTWELVTGDGATYYLAPNRAPNGTVYRLSKTLDHAARLGYSAGRLPSAGGADRVDYEQRSDRILFLDRL